jgi:hypothetical protein
LIVRIMSTNLPTPRDAASSRLRRVITTVLMIMLAIMIVRDIFARRWGSTAGPRQDIARQDITRQDVTQDGVTQHGVIQDVTQRSP